MIGIIDYGLGNLKAFHTIFHKEGIEHKPISKKSDFEGVEKIILPGVGAFDYAMERLEESGLLEELNNQVLNKKTPVLGVCVGMQIMAKHSDEGKREGLGWLDASVKKLEVNNSLPLPHMGWNNLIINKNEEQILDGVPNGSDFYFLHSYYLSTNNEQEILATGSYGQNFTAVIRKENIYGMQCHPEKSHQVGVQFLKNYAGVGKC